MQIIKVQDPKYVTEKIYSVTWEITKKCNYKCSYCDIFGEYSQEDSTDETILFINNFGKNRNLRVTLFGGEPTTHPNLVTILKKLKNKVSLFTNMSESIEYYEDLIKVNPNIEILATYHPSKVDFFYFFKKIKILSKKNTVIKVTFMLDPTIPLDYKNNYAKLRSLNIRIEIHKVVYKKNRVKNNAIEDNLVAEDSSRVIEVTYEDQTKLITSSEYLLSNRLNNFKFFKCCGGLNNLYISNKGFVYSCLDYRRQKKEIGHVTNLNIADLRGTICMLDQCTSDLELPKERVLFTAEVVHT